MSEATAVSPRIVLDPEVMLGKPVVRGTRITVEHVVGLMAEGWSEAQLLDNHPQLTRADIQACLAHARGLVASERVFPTAARACGSCVTRTSSARWRASSDAQGRCHPAFRSTG